MSRASYHSRSKRGGSGAPMYNHSTSKKLSAQNSYQRMADVRQGIAKMLKRRKRLAQSDAALSERSGAWTFLEACKALRTTPRQWSWEAGPEGDAWLAAYDALIGEE